MTAKEIIEALNMQPHPEGGHYVQTFQDKAETNGRSVGTAIYFLLQKGEVSHWHKVDATEIWFYHSGAPLELSISDGTQQPTIITVGLDLVAGQRPQGIVPANQWQSAKTTGDWTLVSCTVSPGFEFERFILAKPDWEPGFKLK